MPSIESTIPDKRQNKVDVAKALKMRLQNKLTFQEIADYFGVTRQTIHEHLQRFTAILPDPEVREAYAQSKAEVLEGVQFSMIASLTDKQKMRKATLGNMAYAASKLDEMIRLERGQSTANVNVLTAMIDQSHSHIFKKSKAQPSEPEASADDSSPTP